MQTLILPVRLAYCTYAAFVFILLMFLVLPFLLVAILMGVHKGGNFLNYVCRVWAYVWLFLIGIRTKRIYLSPFDPSRQYIYVANHISYLDIPMIFRAIRKPVRVLGKAEMSDVPVFGWIYRYATVTVNRSNPEARAASVRRLRNELKRGISIFLFPEGTFNTSEKLLKDFYDGAFKLAIEMQLPIQPLLFVDTKRRMHYKSLLCLNPGISRSVFLDVVETNGLTPADLPQLKELVFKKMEKGLEAFL